MENWERERIHAREWEKRALRLDSGVSERPQVEEWGDGKASGERLD